MKTDRQKQVEDYAYAIYNKYYNYLFFAEIKDVDTLEKFDNHDAIDEASVDMAVIAMETALSFNVDADTKTIMKHGSFIIEVIAELKTYKDEIQQNTKTV